MPTILLIRHANTSDVGIRLSGRNTSVHLSAVGQQQANELAKRFSGMQVGALYSSPQPRALQTAGPLAAALGIGVQEVDAFNELHFGEWTGKSFEQLRGDERFACFNSFRSNTRIPGGETMLEAQARFLGGLEQLITRHAQEVIAIVSHSDMIKAVLAHYLGMHLDQMQRLEINPASVSAMHMYPETARVFLVNHCGPLELSA